ncbi:MAG: hypothetical protein R3F34_07285 [Planctomycetota bacterium]
MPRFPEGSTSSTSPTRATPETGMPVQTVPKPCLLNTRWTGMRNTPSAERGAVSAAMDASAERSASTPSPVTPLTGKIGASSRNVPARNSRTSSAASRARSGSTASIFVSATSPRRIPRICMIARCSRVCGMTPSSAATTSTTRSMPVAPATMLRMKRSCPGTSTSPTRRPSGNSMFANPRSMVSPRSFSSFNRSGSIPVSARTSVLLP